MWTPEFLNNMTKLTAQIQVKEGDEHVLFEAHLPFNELMDMLESSRQLNLTGDDTRARSMHDLLSLLEDE